jgi:hypothetical protein
VAVLAILLSTGGTAAAQPAPGDDGEVQHHEVWCEYEVSMHDLTVFDQPSTEAHPLYTLWHGNVVMVRELLDGEDGTWRDLNYSLGQPQWARGAGLERVPGGECVRK